MNGSRGSAVGAVASLSPMEAWEEAEEDFQLCPPPSREQLESLKFYFGHEKFRPNQWPVIYGLLVLKKDHIVIMSTGAGKSLLFQYPAVFWEGLTLVVEPLIAIMQEQTKDLQKVIYCDYFSSILVCAVRMFIYFKENPASKRPIVMQFWLG